MLTTRNLIASIFIHAVTIVVIFVLPSMNLMSKPKPDVISVKLLSGIPSGSLKPSMPPPDVTEDNQGKDESVKPTVKDDEAKPVELEKPKDIQKPKPPVEKKAEPKKKPTQSKSRSKDLDSKTKKTDKVKELDAAALANADDSSATEVAAPAGSPFGTVKVDNPDFSPFTWWMTQSFNKIQANMRNTVQTDERLVCELYFQVLRSGRVSEARIVNSSGDPTFDQDCLDAIERSAPFPPLPAAFKEELIGITLPFLNAN